MGQILTKICLKTGSKVFTHIHPWNQAVITLSYEDWEEFVEVLEIKKAVIVHDEALKSAIRAKS